MLTQAEAKLLGIALAKLVEERGLGAIGKKDYEVLLFHHLENSTGLQSKSNYELSNRLKITEARVKTLRLEASLRYQPSNHKAILGRIVQRLIDDVQRPEFKGGSVWLTLENPVERRELEHAAKVAKHSLEYGRNRELIEISPLALFDIIIMNVDSPESHLKDIVRRHIQAQDDQRKILDATLTIRERVNKLGEALNEKAEIISLLTSGLGLLMSA
jgi:hypothetical protein